MIRGSVMWVRGLFAAFSRMSARPSAREPMSASNCKVSRAAYN